MPYRDQAFWELISFSFLRSEGCVRCGADCETGPRGACWHSHPALFTGGTGCVGAGRLAGITRRSWLGRDGETPLRVCTVRCRGVRWLFPQFYISFVSISSFSGTALYIHVIISHPQSTYGGCFSVLQPKMLSLRIKVRDENSVISLYLSYVLS